MELDKSIDILFKFMQHLIELKQIIEKDLTIEQYFESLFPYIELFRNNVTYTFELLSNYNNSTFKNSYIETLNSVNIMYNCLEDFCNYSLLNKMNFTETLENKFDKFTYRLGESLIKIGETLKYSKELLQ